MTPAMHGLTHFAALALALSLTGCKSEETLPRTGPAENPAAAPAPAASAAPSATSPAAPATAVATPRSPGQPAATSSSPGPAAADAGAASDAGRADAAAPDAGAASSTGTKIAACVDKCQAVLQGCITPTFSADRGLPQIKDPAACRAAFDACRAACKP